SFLSTLTGEVALSDGDVIAVRDAEGSLLATTKGDVFSPNRGAFLAPPQFEGPSGVKKFPGEVFNDGLARIVAWRVLDKYGLNSYVGLAEKNLFSSYTATARSYFNIAMAASAVLLFLAVVGMYLTWRFVVRKKHAEQVRHT